MPYHYEYVEEWMLVVSGEATVRTPEGERTVSAGELVRFEAGPEGAHKISNRGSTVCRTLLFSAVRGPAVSVYPDSNKIGVWPAGEGADDLLFVRDTAVPVVPRRGRLGPSLTDLPPLEAQPAYARSSKPR